MSKIKIYIIFCIINICISQVKKATTNKKTSPVKQKKAEKTAQKEVANQKNKLLQTLYLDSISKNYYYTILYIGEKKVKQTYVIDVGTSIMSSPCYLSNYCGEHKTHYLDNSDKKSNVPKKCSSKICSNMLPSSECSPKDKNKDKKNCEFYFQKSNGEGLKGYYLNKDVYFEETPKAKAENQKKVYKSFAVPIGCTSAEYGFYKEMQADGVMGLDNEKNSFISLLYNLKIIDNNLFSLCLGSEGGYMSLGEIDTTYHHSKKINYIVLAESLQYYSFYFNEIILGNNKLSLSTKVKAYIDTRKMFTYLPKAIHKTLIKEFYDFCTSKKGKNKCGKLVYEKDYGYCADFEDRQTLLKTVKNFWPNITVQFNNFNFFWKPINYHYYYNKGKVIKACFGFKSHQSEKTILGINFMRWNDVIFDRDKKLVGIVSADCSRKAIAEETNKEALPAVTKGKANPTPAGKQNLKSEINNELEFNKSRIFNLVILLIAILIIIIIVLIVIIILLYKNKEYTKIQTVSDEGNKLNIQNNVIEDINDNRITQEEAQFLKNMMRNKY